MAISPIYKHKKIITPVCPQCREFLTGNGSAVLPYECKCGVWRFQDDGYVIKPHKIIPRYYLSTEKNFFRVKNKN